MINRTAGHSHGLLYPLFSDTYEEYKMRDVDKVFNNIYTAFGTDSGVLFGIPASQKKSVRAIIQATLDWVDLENCYE